MATPAGRDVMRVMDIARREGIEFKDAMLVMDIARSEGIEFKDAMRVMDIAREEEAAEKKGRPQKRRLRYKPDKKPGKKPWKKLRKALVALRKELVIFSGEKGQAILLENLKVIVQKE